MKTKLTVLSFLVALPVWAQINLGVGTNSIVWPVPRIVREIDQIKIQQYTAFDPNYATDKSNFLARFRPAGERIFAEEYSGKDVRCANQIYIELLWLISSTADFKRMNERLDDMESILDSATNAISNSNSAPECVSEWWERLEWSYGHLKKDEPIPPDILDRINSPEKLTAYLMPLSVSDISRVGRDNWWQFNMSLADLIRWVVRDRPNEFDPRLKKTLMDLVLRFQDPETGYWGQRYVVNGREQFVPDLSTTFHIVTYLKGNVPHLDKIVATTLATKDLDSPVGWLWKGRNYNHNNVDVLFLLRFGWPVSGAEQKKAIAAGIQSMVDRCLSESLQPDGSFKHLGGDVSIEEATYFGVDFLYNAGYFDKSKRFWTDREFPHNEEARQKIIAFIKKHQKSGAAGGGDYNEMLEDLQKAH